MSKSNNESNGSSPWLKGGLAGVAIFSVLLLVIYGLYLTIKAPMGIGDDNTGITWYAQYGDAFGVITSFFTAAGTIGLVGTIILQYQTLKAQKEELSETRKEIAGQREELRKQEVAMTAQVRTMERQQVEATFFRLMDKHQSIINSFGHENGMSSKNEAVLSMLEMTNQMILNKRRINNGDAEYYKLFFEKSVLFCRSFYQVISYVDCSVLSDSEKYSLIKLFRYELGNSELTTIAANAMYVDKEKQLKRVIEKYSILKHMSKIEQDLASFFEDSAFGENALRLKYKGVKQERI
tara:strand:- start:1916 stop:2797 length:882 start_codon:yes stop_codon:yes gene_type:complete